MKCDLCSNEDAEWGYVNPYDGNIYPNCTECAGFVNSHFAAIIKEFEKVWRERESPPPVKPLSSW